MVSLNGFKFGPIFPSGGMRQEDPLFPYLFVLCVEGIFNLFRQAKLRGDIHGSKIYRQAPSISNPLFADDNFFFFKASIQECTAVKSILQTYENAYGQAVNFQIQRIFFSVNVPDEVKIWLTNSWVSHLLPIMIDIWICHFDRA